MAEKHVELKKLVVEFRYKPTLKVYARMDQIGLDLEPQFPDWARSPLALEIRNKLKHRRLTIQHTQSVFECDGPEDLDKELEVGRESVTKVCDGLGVSEFTRFGMRSRFVVPSEDQFDDLVTSVHGKFCTPIESIPAFSGMKLADTAFVVDVVYNDWTYNVNLGPMKKDQWFALIPHERQVFQDAPHEETFEKFRATIPEHFIFIDVNVYRTNLPKDDALHVFRANYKRSGEIAQQLVEYYRSN